eukprot:751579-Prorocentrum_minimum.AAC.1
MSVQSEADNQMSVQSEADLQERLPAPLLKRGGLTGELRSQPSDLRLTLRPQPLDLRLALPSEPLDLHRQLARGRQLGVPQAVVEWPNKGLMAARSFKVTSSPRCAKPSAASWIASSARVASSAAV